MQSCRYVPYWYKIPTQAMTGFSVVFSIAKLLIDYNVLLWWRWHLKMNFVSQKLMARLISNGRIHRLIAHTQDWVDEDRNKFKLVIHHNPCISASPPCNICMLFISMLSQLESCTKITIIPDPHLAPAALPIQTPTRRSCPHAHPNARTILFCPCTIP